VSRACSRAPGAPGREPPDSHDPFRCLACACDSGSRPRRRRRSESGGRWPLVSPASSSPSGCSSARPFRPPPRPSSVLPTSQQIAASPVTDRGPAPANARSYFGARYYRAGIGRFTTADPGHIGGCIFSPQRWNAFGYARNSPLRFVDPTGEDVIIALYGYDAVRVSDSEWAWVTSSSPGFRFIRVACASDVGEWCMYCEPNNEIAVIALRQADAAARYASAMARVRATRLEDATREPPLSYGFSERALSREWREQLLREYASRTL
jgi:RHS repeat-associated protein